jgi:hypothetical protein
MLAGCVAPVVGVFLASHVRVFAAARKVTRMNGRRRLSRSRSKSTFVPLLPSMANGDVVPEISVVSVNPFDAERDG